MVTRVATHEDLLELVSDYQSKGWKTLPADNPRRGLMGFWAFKGAQEEACEWSIFGQDLIPEDHVCASLEGLLDVVAQEKSRGQCLLGVMTPGADFWGLFLTERLL